MKITSRLYFFTKFLPLLALVWQPPAAAEINGHVDLYFVSVIDVKVESASGDDDDGDGDGFGVKAKVNFSDRWFADAEYQSSEYELQGVRGSTDVDQFRLGLAYRYANFEKVSAFVKADFLQIDNIENDNGFGLYGGVLLNPLNKLALKAQLGIVSFGEAKGPEFNLGLRYNVSARFDLFTDVRSTQLSEKVEGERAETDVTDWRIGGGFRF